MGALPESLTRGLSEPYELRGPEDVVPLVVALRAVHDAGVVHRDIRRGNVLRHPTTRGPLIIDWAFACDAVPRGSVPTFAGAQRLLPHHVQDDIAAGRYYPSRSHDLQIMFRSCFVDYVYALGRMGPDYHVFDEMADNPANPHLFEGCQHWSAEWSDIEACARVCDYARFGDLLGRLLARLYRGAAA